MIALSRGHGGTVIVMYSHVLHELLIIIQYKSQKLAGDILTKTLVLMIKIALLFIIVYLLYFSDVLTFYILTFLKGCLNVAIF